MDELFAPVLLSSAGLFDVDGLIPTATIHFDTEPNSFGGGIPLQAIPLLGDADLDDIW